MPEFKIASKNKVGFISIKLQLNHKKPILIFKLKDIHISEYFYSKNDMPGIGHDYLSFRAIAHKQEEYTTLTITGTQKVYAALQFFLNDEHYNTPQNQPVKQKLVEYINYLEQQLIKAIHTKICKVIEPPTNTERINPKDIHSTAIISTRQGKQFIYKKFITGNKLSVYETFAGYCYLLLLGPNHVPKAKVALNKYGARIGGLSEYIKNFVPLHNFFNTSGDNSKLTAKELLQTGIVNIWVTAYCLQEDDLHLLNYGFDAKNYPSRTIIIDFDRAFIPVTAKYHTSNHTENRGLYLSEQKPHFIKPAVHSFATNINDIRAEIINFPNLTVSTPFHWPRLIDGKANKSNKILLSVVNEPSYQQTYYKQFFKIAILTSFILAAFKLFPELSLKAKRHIEKHFENLKQALLFIPQYQTLALHNPQLLEELKQEIEAVNNLFKKPDHPLRIDLDKLTQAYYAHLEEIRSAVLQSVLNGFSNTTTLVSALEQYPELCIADNYFLIIEALSQEHVSALKILFAKAINYIPEDKMKTALLKGIYSYLTKENFKISRNRIKDVVSLLILSCTSPTSDNLIAQINDKLSTLNTGWLGQSALRRCIYEEFDNIAIDLTSYHNAPSPTI